MNVNRMKIRISSLSLLNGIRHGGILEKLYETLKAMDRGCEEFIAAYGALTGYTLDRGGLKESLADDILSDGNVFAQKSGRIAFDDIGEKLKRAAGHDVAALNAIVGGITAQDVLEAGAQRFEDAKEDILALPPFDEGKEFRIGDARGLYDFYRGHGYGYFAKNFVCVYQDKKIIGVRHPDPVRLFDLKGYERQKATVMNNTRLFLSGEEANNVLLYGDKGTGKSSTVKAILNEFKDRGLRLIELRKEYLNDFHELCEILSESPFKFIVFLDDISFVREDDSFGTLKAVIEGGIVKRPDNVIIYATSNRRHMIGESFSDRKGDDIHIRDTIETVASLSDRFGIEVVFGAPDKDEYLLIVEALAREKGLDFEAENLELLAERFALLKSGRSPRTARQFIMSMLAKKQK